MPPLIGFAIAGVAVGLVATLVVPRLMSSSDKKTGAAPRPVSSASGRFQRVRTLQFSHEVESVAFSPDGSHLAAMAGTGQLTIMQILDTSSWHTNSRIPDAGAQFLAYSPDGRRLVTDGLAGARLWDPGAGRPAGDLSPGSDIDGRGPVAFSPDGSTLAHAQSVGAQTGAAARTELHFWNAQTLATARAYPFAGGGQDRLAEAHAIAYSPDGSLVAVGGQYLTSASGGAQVQLVTPAEPTAPRTLVTSFSDKTVNLNAAVQSVAFSPDGRTLAVSTWDGQAMNGVRLWDPASGRLVTTVAADGGGTVTYSPDGRLLTFGTGDGDVVEVWDTTRRRAVATLQLGQNADGTPTYGGGQQFDPDGRLLAVPVGSTVQLWSMPGGPALRPSTKKSPVTAINPTTSQSPAASATPSASSTPTVGDRAGAGARCGDAGTGPTGGELQLIIKSGTVTCTRARKVLDDYRASRNRQGSGGFATVDGWSCGHNSIAGYQQSHRFEGCQRGRDAFETRADR